MKALGVTLVVLVGLLVAADRIAVAVAQGRVEQELRAQEGVADAREVDITGFPFLTQALAGSYGEVEVDLTLDESSEVPGTRVQLALQDVAVPLSEALSGSVDRIDVERVDGTATLPYDVLARQIGDSTTLEADGEGLRITRTVSLLGVEAPLSATGTVAVEDGNLLVISVDEAEAVGVDVPDVFLTEGRELLEVSYQLPDPPYGLRVTSVAPGRDGVVVGLEADAVVLGS